MRGMRHARTFLIALIMSVLCIGGLTWQIHAQISRESLNRALIVAINTKNANKENTMQVRMLLDRGADPNAYDDRDMLSLSLLQRLRILFGLSSKKTGQETALIAAARMGKDDIVDLLLIHGAYVNATVEDGNTALHYAIWSDSHMVEALLKKGANPNARYGDEGWTALMRGPGLEPDKFRLIVKYGGDVTLRDNEGDTTLMCLAGEGDDEAEVARALIAGGVDVNAKDKDGNTALMIAVAQGRKENVVDLLLAQHADVNARNNKGRTALDMASEEYVTQALKTAGGKP